MAYCIQADIEKRISLADIVSLTDDAGTETVDTDNLAEAIAQADGRIDGSLRGRFVLPLPTVPAIVKFLSVDMAVYHLFTRKPSIEFPAIITARYNEALKQLGDISSGVLQIFSKDDPALAGFAGDILCNKTESDQEFTPALLDTF